MWIISHTLKEHFTGLKGMSAWHQHGDSLESGKTGFSPGKGEANTMSMIAINQEKCTACGICGIVCPRYVLVILEGNG